MDSTTVPMGINSTCDHKPSRGGWNAAIFIICKLFFIFFLYGMILLTLSVSMIPLHSREIVFFVALYILVVGESGHKPCVQTFAADQFDETSPQERMGKNPFFNWWYLGIMVGGVSAVLVVVYVQDNVGWGFAILAASMALAFGIFLVGIKKYRKQRPVGSPLTTMAQVLVAAARKMRVDETCGRRGVFYGDTLMEGNIVVETQTKTLSQTQQFRILDKAMIIDDIDASSNTRNPWRLCSLNQVEEVKQVFGLIPVWLASLYSGLVHAQTTTLFSKQGSTRVRSIGPNNFNVSPASLLCITGVVVITFFPIFDRILMPLIRIFTGKPTGITIFQRIGVGLFVSVLTMLVAALVESKRVKTASDHNLLDSPKAITPIRVWWLIPQYVLQGFGDALCIVGTKHLFYDQMPETMRSIGTAFHLANAGVANFISSALISIVEGASKKKWLGNNLNRSHLDHYYFLIAGIGLLNLGVYVAVTRRYVYTNVEGNYERKDDEGFNNGHPKQTV